MPGKMLDSEATIEGCIDVKKLEADLRSAVHGEVRFDTGSRALYATDASNYRQIPIGVVLPRTKRAAIETVAVCRDHGAPLVSRGAGTGLAGSGCNAAVVIDFSKYLNRVLEVDPERRTARVEPGLILDHLNGLTEPRHNLIFGPDPATRDCCTLGGMIGTNACGAHSISLGRTVDHIIELEILTYDGLRMRIGSTSDQDFEKIMAQGGPRAEIYRRLRDLRDRRGDLIRRRFPKVPGRSSGFNLEDLLPENGFNLARALVGSEGACVTILEAIVRLVYSPPYRSLLVLGYPDVFIAADQVPRILSFQPLALEGLDDLLVTLMRRKEILPRDITLPQGQGWLLVEFGGDSSDEADRKAHEVMETLRNSDSRPEDMRLYMDPQQQRRLMEVGEAGLGATANIPGMPLTWPGWEDAAVQPDNLGHYLREFRDLLNRRQLVGAMFGHFGLGCVHGRISFDLFTQRGIRNYREFLEEASDLVAKYNGTLSSHHGDGQARAAFLPKMFGPELIEAFRDFKSIWDPHWKMNPGKAVDAYLPEQNLRLGLGYNPWEPMTDFHFIDDQGSFPRASLRCVGVGKCRRPHDAFMCPSFLVTRDENDTTRGRAHLLFEMLRGDLVKDGWRSREVMDSLDLCLACKGCKSECPVNVDVSTYRSEFLHHYYKGRLRPRDTYTMGLFGFWALLGSKIPRTANTVTHLPLVNRLTKFAAGISGRRSLPRWAPFSFTAWFRRRMPVNQGQPIIVLYPDPFNNVFFPKVLSAAVLMLERWGYRVMLPPGAIPDTRAFIHYGMLDLARWDLRRTLRLMRPFASRNLPIIFLEPSSAALYRDELLNLLPNEYEAERFARLCVLLSEFIMAKNLPVPRLAGKVLFHAHCHDKAVLNAKAAREVLRKMGLQIEEPWPGCCGMAGSFGYQSKHYEVSMKIAEEKLLPAVRQASPDDFVVADGFSCRSQILEGTGREPMHLSELLLYAVRQGVREIRVGEVVEETEVFAGGAGV